MLNNLIQILDIKFKRHYIFDNLSTILYPISRELFLNYTCDKEIESCLILIKFSSDLSGI